MGLVSTKRCVSCEATTSDMTARNCVVCGREFPRNELDRLRAENAAQALLIASLKEELSKFQESSFNPDWSMLEATRESLREHMGLLKGKTSKIEALKDLLERAQNGLRWYADMHPDDASEADGELHVEIDEALA
jgi:hypothetical protein